MQIVQLPQEGVFLPELLSLPEFLSTLRPKELTTCIKVCKFWKQEVEKELFRYKKAEMKFRYLIFQDLLCFAQHNPNTDKYVNLRIEIKNAIREDTFFKKPIDPLRKNESILEIFFWVFMPCTLYRQLLDATALL